LGPEKLRAEWERSPPKYTHSLRSFSGLHVICWKFIMGFADITKLLIQLTRKVHFCHCSPVVEAAFQSLKK
jgi:hypothetical protein